MEILKSLIELLKWPVVVIIIALFFKKPLSGLLNRIKSIKGGKYALDTEPQQNQIKAGTASEAKETKIEKIEKSLNVISEDTRKIFQEAINKETEIDKIKNPEEKSKALYNYAEALYIHLQFGRIYNLIFGSQISLLNHLNSSHIETIDSIKFFYDNAVTKYPHLKNYPYENYLSFLQEQGLINISDKNKITITSIGRDFLKYLIDMGLSDLKYN